MTRDWLLSYADPELVAEAAFHEYDRTGQGEFLLHARLASGLWALGLERPEADRGIGKGGVRVVHCTDRPLLRSGGDGENRAQNELEKLEAVAAVWQTSRSSPDKLFGVLVIDEDCRDAGMTIEHRMGQTGISYIDDRHFDLVGKSSVA